ncbi:MAG: hypothetical protein RIE86_25400 [Imperialibacter sp.]|uniref:hypothetical protein n=1 Tax=Imperialibacter sp. TaxID=2038411 RepID=UPI0032F01840
MTLGRSDGQMFGQSAGSLEAEDRRGKMLGCSDIRTLGCSDIQRGVGRPKTGDGVGTTRGICGGAVIRREGFERRPEIVDTRAVRRSDGQTVRLETEDRSE